MLQTARITELESSILKVEMRGHENTVECAAFVPLAAATSIRELISQVCSRVIFRSSI